MKKIFLTAALGIAAIGANAQIRFGAEVGVQLANQFITIENPLTGDDEHIDAKPNLGLRGGLVAQFNITDHLAIQPAILFAMKGARQEYSSDFPAPNTEYQSKLNMNYIEIPINFQYNLGEDGTGFFVGAGPYVGYAFGGKVVSQINNVEVENRDIEFGDDLGDDYKNIDFGVGLNAGYMLPMGAFVRAYGQYGFSNIFPDFVSSFGKTRNYGFGLTVGYMIGGGN